MTQRLPSPSKEASEYFEERVPFDDVLRRLVSAPPAHKVAKTAAKVSAAKRAPSKTATPAKTRSR